MKFNSPVPFWQLWWQVSFLVAVLVTMPVFLWASFSPPVKAYSFLIAAAVFLTVFALLIYFDPDLWYRRMAVATLLTLLGGQFFAGLSLAIPVPWDSRLAEIEVPGVHWSVSALLALLIIFFALLHFWTRNTD